MKLVFVRHGESEANLLREFSNRGLKHGLTPTGRQQAARLARTLHPILASKIYASPLLRAVQTAEILSNKLDIPFEITTALREYDCGILEGRSDEKSWQLYEVVFEAWLNGDWTQRIEQGESFVDIQQRFVPFIKRLVRTYGESGKSIVLVGHGGLYRCMLPLVLTNIDFDFVRQHSIPHTASIIAKTKPEGLVCSNWGDTSL